MGSSTALAPVFPALPREVLEAPGVLAAGCLPLPFHPPHAESAEALRSSGWTHAENAEGAEALRSSGWTHAENAEDAEALRSSG